MHAVCVTELDKPILKLQYQHRSLSVSYSACHNTRFASFPFAFSLVLRHQPLYSKVQIIKLPSLPCPRPLWTSPLAPSPPLCGARTVCLTFPAAPLKGRFRQVYFRCPFQVLPTRATIGEVESSRAGRHLVSSKSDIAQRLDLLERKPGISQCAPQREALDICLPSTSSMS